MTLTDPLTQLGPASRACLLAGLISSRGDAVPQTAWHLEAPVIVREGLASTALALARSGAVDLPTDALHIFRHAALAQTLHTLEVQRTSVPFLKAAQALHVPTTVIKGLAVARLYPSGWPRDYSDIDLLVSPHDFPALVRAAAQEGFSLLEDTDAWPWFLTTVREGVNLHSGATGNIDIHHHLPPWALTRTLSVSDIMEHAIPTQTLFGSPVHAASPGHCLVIAALHVLNDRWKGKAGLVSWRDMLVVSESLGAAATTSAFQDAGLSWLLRLVSRALSRHAPHSVLARVPADTGMPCRYRFRLHALAWGDWTALNRQRIAWAARLPPLNAFLFLVGTAVPAPSYIRRHDNSYLRYWLRGLREIIATTHGADFRGGPPASDGG
jgi:hypothetical protein